MNTYYASILDEKILQEKANTNKKISISLDNVFELNEKEYLSLYAFFLYEACSTDFEWRFTGSCYLMLLQERNPERFKSHFLSVISMVYGSCDSNSFCEDYYDLGGVLIVCDFDVYKQLLKMAINASDEDIRQDANRCINDVVDNYKSETFFINLIEEYNVFKQKLEN